MNRKLIALCMLFLVFLSSCNKGLPSAINPEVLPTGTPPPAPEAGKATAIGQVKHQDGSPFSDVIVRLANVARDAQGKGGAYILDIAHSPSTYSDAYGYFIIQNIDPGEYVIVIGDVEVPQLYEVVQESNGDAKVWNFPVDQVTDVGVLTVSFIIPTLVPTNSVGAYPEPTAYPSP
jgi:hypothetical protein